MLYQLLNDNGGKLIISMAPKYKDQSSDWSQMMHELIGEYFDSLSTISSVCSAFQGCKIEIFDEEDSFDTTYTSLDKAIHGIIWNMMEELSFARKYHQCLQDEDQAIKILKSYLIKNCLNKQTNECPVSATVGHIVITKTRT